eukprot:TRINITY_DN36434_c0_g1_i1.p1 TRINITY_DN36434_c0_g1~~TRINITY_DN36434_c0_g1_i1.p1  ORF type:complete len:153 (+),score=32.04 TRINITY_DN36434_c0_g1_i1:78-536(+)
MVFGQIFGAAANAASAAASAASAAAEPRPPPKVWCVTLRRKPIQTTEDEPEIGDCEKICIKIMVIPLALITYLIGWIISLLIYMIGCCCCPVCGPAVFTAFAQARMQSIYEKGAGQAKQDAENIAGCASCLVRSYVWVYWNLIRPLGMFCEW